MGRRRRDLFCSANNESRRVVEPGFGLSHATPTGQLFSDECLQGTFHFGLGNALFFDGENDALVRLDLVSWI